MGKSAIVAVAQIQWKRFDSESALQDELIRFLRLARNKSANVVLFPEMVGLLLAAPLAKDKQDTLNKGGGFLERLRNSLTGTLDLTKVLPTLIEEHSDELVERYTRLFGGLAAEYRMMLVAGTLLAKDEQGIVRYRAGIFDSDGSLLGWQNKLHLSPQEQAVAEPGDEVKVFNTPFGRIGVLPGHDLLFPEVARALAYRGCVGLFNPTTAYSRDSWQRQRLLAGARAQENQLFVAQGYLVGETTLAGQESSPLVGRSAVLAPVELSPRGDGILAEVGAEKVEGVVSGEWNPDSLRNLWRSAEVPLREMVRGTLYHDLLAFDHQSGSTIAERTEDIEGVAIQKEQPETTAVTPVTEPLPATDAPQEPTENSLRDQEESVSAPPQPDQEAAHETPEDALQTDPDEKDTELSTGVESDPQSTSSRYMPIIDPDTGKYLGEKRVDE